MDHEIELKFLIAPEASNAILARLRGGKRFDSSTPPISTPSTTPAQGGLRPAHPRRRERPQADPEIGLVRRGVRPRRMGERGGRPEPDRELLAQTPAAQVINGDALAPVFATNVKRVTRLIERDGATIEAALDQGELLADDRRAAVSELELELKAGAPRVLFDLARDLAAHAPLRLSLVSKAERGYALALDEADGPRPDARWIPTRPRARRCRPWDGRPCAGCAPPPRACVPGPVPSGCTSCGWRPGGSGPCCPPSRRWPAIRPPSTSRPS
jgi:triphosphatase